MDPAQMVLSPAWTICSLTTSGRGVLLFSGQRVSDLATVLRRLVLSWSIDVPPRYSFWDLHVAMQDAMGWADCHLHAFAVDEPKTGRRLSIGIPDSDFPYSPIVIINDPSHEDFEEMMQWLGGSFDAEAFDPASVRFDDPEVRWKRAFE